MFKKSVLLVISMMVAVCFSMSVQAKSQCSGLTKSVCSVNDTCTWRKASVDKNGKKTKAHCRALPGKSKAKKASSSKKSSAVKSTKSKAKSTTKSKASKASKSTKSTKTKTKKKSVDKKSVKKKAKKTTEKAKKKKTKKSSKS